MGRCDCTDSLDPSHDFGGGNSKESKDKVAKLDKMGLKILKEHGKQQGLTSIMYRNWNTTESAPTTMKIVETQRDDTPETSECHPCDKLVSGFSYKSPAVVKCQIHHGFDTFGKRIGF
jgi:hypothetical protein